MKKINKREFIKYGTALGAASISPSIVHAAAATPSETEGPFYPVIAQKDKDFDLTIVEGRDGVAKGETIFVQGRILDIDENSVEDAMVDLWQANAEGRYSHPHAPATAPLDPDFQGWAMVPSGKEGTFKFKTIKPGAYGAGRWGRTPHIHFKISKRGYEELTTQMYFPGEKQNETDFLYQGKTVEEQALMTAKELETAEGAKVYQFDIYIRQVG